MPPPPAEPATFKWLAGLPIPDLVQDHELPFAAVGRLQSLLHDGVLRAGRASPTSSSAVTEEALRNLLSSRLSSTHPSDAALAAELTRSAEDVLFFPLPNLRTTLLNCEQVHTELRDTATCLKGGSAADMAVAKRLHLGANTDSELAELAREVPSVGSRLEALQRLSSVVVPPISNSTAQLQFRPVSQLLHAKSPLAATARAAGKSGLELVDVLTADAMDVLAASRASTAITTDADPQQTVYKLSQEADKRALDSPQFQEAAAIIAAVDISTAEGRRQVLSTGLLASAPIFQMLLDRPVAHKGKHAALTKFHACTNELPTYLGIAQAIDEATGQVPEDKAAWVPPDDEVARWTHGEVASCDFLSTRTGALAVLNLASVEPYLDVPSAQRYITPSCLEAEGAFGHRSWVAWGAPAVSSTGYTFKTFFEKHLANVRATLELPSAVQADLLPHARTSALAGLHQMARNLRLFLDSPEPASAALPHLLGFGEQYDRSWAQKFSALQPLLVVQRALPGLVPASKPRQLPGVTSGSASTTTAPTTAARSQPVVRPSQPAKPRPARAAPPSKPERKMGVGSLAHAAKWSPDHRYLTMGSERYDVKGICDELKLDKKAADALDWPVLLTTKPREERLRWCQDPRHKDHQGPNAIAHTNPKGFDLNAIRAKYLTQKAPADGAAKGKKGTKRKRG